MVAINFSSELRTGPDYNRRPYRRSISFQETSTSHHSKIIKFPSPTFTLIKISMPTSVVLLEIWWWITRLSRQKGRRIQHICWPTTVPLAWCCTLIMNMKQLSVILLCHKLTHTSQEQMIHLINSQRNSQETINTCTKNTLSLWVWKICVARIGPCPRLFVGRQDRNKVW